MTIARNFEYGDIVYLFSYSGGYRLGLVVEQTRMTHIDVWFPYDNQPITCPIDAFYCNLLKDIDFIRIV